MLDDIGQKYYTNFFEGLYNSGIAIIADLYHHDLPQSNLDNGGWNNDIIVEDFTNYAQLCFNLYAHYVGHWITIASPLAEASFECKTV